VINIFNFILLIDNSDHPSLWVLANTMMLKMGLGQKILSRVGLGQTSLVWVWIFYPQNPKFFKPLGKKKYHWVGSKSTQVKDGASYPQNPKFFNFLPFGSKKISLGWVKKYPSQRGVSLLFVAGQKYARVGSDQGPSLSNIDLIIYR